MHVKVRDGQVANRPVYMALAVTAEGTRDILGLWVGDGGEGAKYWLQVLAEIKNRGVGDVLMLVCDGLTGLPDAVNAVWPATVVQTCVVRLLRNSFRYAGRQDWEKIAKALRPVYTAPTEDATTGGIVIDTRARIGYTAPIGTTDEDRIRHLTVALPPRCAARLFDAQEQGASDQQLQRIAAEALKEMYFQDNGRRAGRLEEVRFTDIEHLEFAL